MISKSKVFQIALFAFLILAAASYSDKIILTVEVFKTNLEIGKVEKRGFEYYNVLDSSFQFALPDDWNTWEQNFSGGEIVYHLNFLSRNKKIHGFIQVWQMEKTLSQFLVESEKSSVDSKEYKLYNKKEITVNDIKGFLVQYERPNSKGSLYKSYDCFLQDNDNGIYRASFYMEKKHWKNYYTIIFNKIIKSFKIK